MSHSLCIQKQAVRHIDAFAYCGMRQKNRPSVALYLFYYRSELSGSIGEALGLKFGMKRMRLGEVRSIVAESKK